VLGLLGALDPYKHKMNLGQIDSQIESTALLSMTDSRPISETEWTTSEMLVNMSTASLEEYYPAVAIATLIRIIRDPNLFQHHTMVVQVRKNEYLKYKYDLYFFKLFLIYRYFFPLTIIIFYLKSNLII